MRLISTAEVHAACDWLALADALRVAHAGPKPLVERSLIAHGEGETAEHYINLAAWLPGVAMGTKIVTVMPGNGRAGAEPPVIQAAYPLFDGKDGRPLAMIDGTALTYRKTAADSALGSLLLSRPDARVMTMVGAGALAPYLSDAHRAVRPGIARVHVWNRTPARAAALARELGAAGLDATATDDLEAAVRQSDIVSCATGATRPLVRGAWLKEGAHIDLVGGYLPEMRESDDEVVRRARLFVDSWWFAVDKPGDLADPIGRGVIGRDKIEGDLFDLCSGTVSAHRKPQDITFFKNGGGAHLDLFTALHIWRSVQGGAGGATIG